VTPDAGLGYYLSGKSGEYGMTKFIFVTGGVVSSGQGIASASRRNLESRVKVTLLKLDPYINVDPGTMSPFSMEVFVTRMARDRPGPRALRALRRRQDDQAQQFHHGPDLQA
jgi:hypothetical protein